MKLKSNTQYDISCFGNGLMDLLAHVPEEIITTLDLNKGNFTMGNGKPQQVLTVLKNTQWKTALGGSALNTLRVSAQLGLHNYFSTKVGKDKYGDELIQKLHDLKIGEDITRSETTPTGTLISLVTPDSERTMVSDVGAAKEFSLKDVKSFEVVSESKIFHTTGYKILAQGTDEVTSKAIEVAKKNNTLISFDPAAVFVIEQNKARIGEILKAADIVFLNEEEVKAYAGTTDKLLEELPDAKLIIIKKGKDGCTIYMKGIEMTVPGFKADAVDSTGAGDSFAGGFLFGLVKGYSLKNCATLGNLVGSKLVQNLGAILTDEDLNSIKQHIKNIEEEKNNG